MIPGMTAQEVAGVETQFGARLRAVRIAQGVTQADLARHANVSRSAMSNLESGDGSSLSTVVKVLIALGRQDWLLSLDVPEEAFNPLDLLVTRPVERPKGPPRVKRRGLSRREPSTA